MARGILIEANQEVICFLICKSGIHFKYEFSFASRYDAVSVWNPCLRKDIDKLESVQRISTRLVPKLRKKSFEYRLTRLGLTSIET